MKTILILLTFPFFILGCNSGKELKNTELTDLNLYLKTDREVDSVFISNITQEREFQFIPYFDTLNVKFNDSINDLYNVSFFINDKIMMNQLWLNGKNIIIKGKITDRLEIDTIIGSDLYYNSIDFRKRFQKLIDDKTDSATINDFLLNELKKNIDNPFSIEIAKKFYFRNISKKDELKKIYALQSNQIDEIKNHLLNSYKKTENILTVDKVNFSNFQFYDTYDEMMSIELEEDKQYLIDFWFMTCAPCIKDHRIMVSKQELLRTNNVQLIGISTDRDQLKWSEYVKGKKYFWQNIREIDEYKERLTTDLLITTFPTYLLLDGTGNILYRTNSFSAIEEYLNKKSL